MFAEKARGYPYKHLSGVPLKVRLLASPTNIERGWKALAETNTLAYYENP